MRWRLPGGACIYARSAVFVTVYRRAIFARNCARDVDNRRSFAPSRIIGRNGGFSARAPARRRGRSPVRDPPSFGSTVCPRAHTTGSLCLNNYASSSVVVTGDFRWIVRPRANGGGGFNSPDSRNRVLSRIYWSLAKIELDLNSSSSLLPIRLAAAAPFSDLVDSLFRLSEIRLFPLPFLLPPSLSNNREKV